MEIDHFNPTLTGVARNDYKNLFLATRHCNNAKRDKWPDRSLRRKGVRLLNPCEEQDYGPHILEHPETHRLVGLTPAGRYHISICDLNASHLVTERKERADCWRLLEKTPITLKSEGRACLDEVLKSLKEQVEKMIPKIDYLSVDHPSYVMELEVAKALFS